MTKEEKIKEAWSKLMTDYTNIDLNNGWSLDDFHEDSYKENEFHTQQIYTPCKIRPKSLKGIENNNGWIKIESEEDLPKEVINCWFATNNGIYLGYYTTRGYFVNEGEDIELKFITHYQPIEKPKPPIY